MFEQYEVIQNAPMRDYTTLKLGGPADWLAFPRSGEEIAGMFREARDRNLPVTVIGSGSNLLVLDGGIRGLVIRIGKNMRGIQTEGRRMTVRAGTMLSVVAGAAADKGLSGLEFASGIPGTAGGGVCMNAGAYDGEMSQRVTEAAGLDPDGREIRLSREELAFGYRRSAIPGRGITVTEVTFELEEGRTDAIRARMAELNRKRAEKQPLDQPSAGSTFKRPEGAFAAALIDQCGLKGYVEGGAQVSTKHAGFLINRGGTSRDYLNLMRHVARVVEERTGIRLEPEVRVLGEETAE